MRFIDLHWKLCTLFVSKALLHIYLTVWLCVSCEHHVFNLFHPHCPLGQALLSLAEALLYLLFFVLFGQFYSSSNRSMYIVQFIFEESLPFYCSLFTDIKIKLFWCTPDGYTIFFSSTFSQIIEHLCMTRFCWFFIAKKNSQVADVFSISFLSQVFFIFFYS